MTVAIDVASDPAQIALLASDWERLVQENPDTADGLDATGGYPWFCALTRTFAPARQARIVVLREAGQVVGLLPLVQEGGGLCKRLAVASELYGGRNGLMLARQDPALLAALLRGVGQAYGPWQSLKLMVVHGSPTDRLLAQASAATGLSVATARGWESPYFALEASQDAFLAGVSKGLKQTVRTSLNKLKTLGQVRYEDIGPGMDPGVLLQAVLDIERDSWKHAAGSAITCKPEQQQFYQHLFDASLASGLIQGLLMYLDDTPVAYNFGLVRAGYYSCLKHSNRQAHQALSPNQVLNMVLVERLRARGVIQYDYMGAVEPHKMRWSPQTRTYLRTPTWVFGRSPCGVAGHALLRAKRWARARLGRQPAASTDDNAG